MKKSSRMAGMKRKNKPLSEQEIDEIVTAQADDDSAWITVDYLKERAARGSREKFLQALSKVPNAEPDEPDRL